MKKRKIAPSILSSNFAYLADAVKIAENGGADYLHIDVMDGHFVPNITIGAPVVKSLRETTDMILDVHLMISDPSRFIDDFADAGTDILTVHFEACNHLHRTLQMIKEKGIKAGVALNPHTPVENLENVLDLLDQILIMTVNPGFGGQKFIPQSIHKLQKTHTLLRENNFLNIDVEVDGGIGLDNIREVSDSGAEVLVSGSSIYNSSDPVKTIKEMYRLLR